MCWVKHVMCTTQHGEYDTGAGRFYKIALVSTLMCCNTPRGKLHAVMPACQDTAAEQVVGRIFI